MIKYHHQMSIRSGGHDYICASLKNDSLHLDLREINVIDLLQESDVPKLVSVSASCTLLLCIRGNPLMTSALRGEGGLVEMWTK